MKLINRIILLIFSLLNFISLICLSEGILEFDLYKLFFTIFLIIWLLVNFILFKLKKNK